MIELVEIDKRVGLINQLLESIRLINFITKLKPVKTQYELLRLGGDRDGGYLLLDDLEGISACFSPGVETTSTFEKDLFDSYGINSHLADYSVDDPPSYFQPLTFTKKFLGAINNDVYMTLDSWVKSTPEYQSTNDLLLQMDIEFGEYATLLATSDEVLQRFRTIVIEVHHIDKWAQPFFLNIVESFFDKLLQHFYIVHAHPNNYRGLVNIDGIELPETIEFTLHAKNRCNVMGFVETFPDILDKPCSPDRPELVLPDIWYK